MNVCIPHDLAYVGKACPACLLGDKLDEAVSVIEDLNETIAKLERELDAATNPLS